jgi:UDP-3-O-[3-hydroxymyristoyl] glucosamine N-acyltransferase
MSCEKLNTILLGGRRGRDGKYPAQREILFSPVGRMVADALPDVCDLVYVRQESEAELEGVPSIVCPDDADFTEMLCAAAEKLDGDVMILSTPMPEVEREEYERVIRMHRQSKNAVSMLTCGAMADTWHCAVFQKPVLEEILDSHPMSLTESIRIAESISAKTESCRTEAHVAVYTAYDAYCAQKTMQRRINAALMDKGINMLDPEYTYVSPYTKIGYGTTILPGSMIKPGSWVGCGCTIGPNTILDCASIGDETSVNSSQVYESKVGAHATVGPFAYIRPGCEVGDHTRIGDFVELKKAHIGNGTKVSHLTYIGDAEVGERVNFGCGTVIVNYDGYVKSKTVIGDDCFIGCNTNLVAPVELGDRVLTAAGTTVTKNVPDGAMAVARARQENKEGWNDRRRRMHGQKD